jgi:hypothetical protein
MQTGQQPTGLCRHTVQNKADVQTNSVLELFPVLHFFMIQKFMYGKKFQKQD